MKSVLFLVTLMLSQVSFASTLNYKCSGDFDVNLQIMPEGKVVISDEHGRKDTLQADLKQMAANPEKKTIRLLGSSSAMGDGVEGYSVDATMSKAILEGRSFGYLNLYSTGADGHLEDSAKCKLTQK